MLLQNKVAMISGAARGIGASTALKLAEEGADISASDLCVEELEKSLHSDKTIRSSLLD